ncbi:MAG: hypothetical protein ABDH49_01120 [Candidatus Hydrothermales bacterium]
MITLFFLVNFIVTDSTRVSLSFLPKIIKIKNEYGSITLGTASQIQVPEVIVKKIGVGERSEAEKWFKKVKVDVAENKRIGELKIKCIFPKFQWNG